MFVVVVSLSKQSLNVVDLGFQLTGLQAEGIFQHKPGHPLSERSAEIWLILRRPVIWMNMPRGVSGLGRPCLYAISSLPTLILVLMKIRWLSVIPPQIPLFLNPRYKLTSPFRFTSADSLPPLILSLQRLSGYIFRKSNTYQASVTMFLNKYYSRGNGSALQPNRCPFSRYKVSSGQIFDWTCWIFTNVQVYKSVSLDDIYINLGCIYKSRRL